MNDDNSNVEVLGTDSNTSNNTPETTDKQSKLNENIKKTGEFVSDKAEKVQKKGEQVEKVGKTGEKIGSNIEKVGKNVERAGSTIETAGKAAEGAGKAAESTGKAAKAASDAMKKGADLLDKGGRAAETAAGGMRAGSGLLKAADTASTVTGAVTGTVAPVVGNAVGAGVGKAVGALPGIAGAGLDVAAAGTEGAGRAAQASATSVKAAAEGLNKASDSLEKAGKQLKDRGKEAKDIGSDIKDRGKAATDVGKDIKGKSQTVTKIGKNIQKGAGTAKAFGDYLQNIDEVKENIKKLPMRLLIFGGCFIIFMIFTVLIAYIYSPFENAMNYIEKGSVLYEKIDNVLLGLGFNSDSEVFSKEIDKLNKYYNNELDVGLLLATVFYEDVELGVDYNNEENLDRFVDTINKSGDANSLFSYDGIYDYVSESAGESSEKGISYTTSKIYRLRDLARHMVKTRKTTSEMEVQEYYKTISSMYGTNVQNIINSNFSTSAESKLLKTIVASIKGNEKLSFTELGATYLETEQSKNEITRLFLSMFIDSAGIFECEEVHNEDATETEYCVHPYLYSFNEDGYYDYLRTKYIPTMPEFADKLSKYEKGSDEYNEAVEDIIDRIIGISDDYYYMFGRGEINDGSIKFDSDALAGQVWPLLVKNMALPVDVKEGFEVSFKDGNNYGIYNKVFNKGILLNKDTIGASTGSEVYSIYDGKIESLTRKGSGEVTATNFDNYLFIGDSRYRGIESKLKQLGSSIYVAAVSGSMPSDFIELSKTGEGTIIVKDGNKIGDQGTFTLPKNIKGVSIMLGVNAISQTKELQTVIENLHSKYPNAKIYVNSVFHIGSSYKGPVTNAQIDSFNTVMKNYCSSKDYAIYIDVTSNLNDDSGYVKSELMISDGLHLNNNGNSLLVENIKSLGGSVGTENSLIIKHTMKISKTTYEFYSKYENIEIDKNLNIGDPVEKGTTLGKIDSTGSLYFEIDDNEGTPINPTNIYISTSTELRGKNNEERIMHYLLDYGFSLDAASGITGNLGHEAYPKYDPVSLKIKDWDYYEKTGIANSGYTSQQFTDEVDAGLISYDEFLVSSRFGSDSQNRYGYGIAGFLAVSYKEILWKNTHEKGLSIGDLGGQLDTLIETMNDSIKEQLMVANSPEEAAWIFASKYEQCHQCVIAGSDEVKLRQTEARAIYNNYKSK